MKGTIKIESCDKSGFSIKMQMVSVTKMDTLLIFDALADAFGLTEEDRLVFGSIMRVGGVKKAFGGGLDMVKIDMGLIDKFRRESE
jgi:hypothetical protein